MNENEYKEIPEEFSLSQVRPRFVVDTQLEPEEIVERFYAGLNEVDAPCKGQAFNTYATLFFPREKRHYWSPQLTLLIEKMDKGSQLRGLYGPRPAVWTMFVFFYAVIGVLTLFLCMIGGTQLQMGKSPWAFYIVPFLVLLFFSLYFVAQKGKNKGKPEIKIMHDFLMKALQL